jgi:rhodanese-related sulfurtransferase
MKAGVAACQVSLMLICASTLVASEDAASGAMPPVVTTGWLAEHLDDPDLVVVHIGRADSFEEGHLPGARQGSLRALIRETETGIRDEMPAANDIADALSKLGIGEDSSVVAYFASEAGAWAVARFVVTLEYAGFGGRVAYLDGGLPKWRAEERPVSTKDTAVEETGLRVALDTDLIVDTAWLSARLGRPEVAIIDGRPQEGYSGPRCFRKTRPICSKVEKRSAPCWSRRAHNPATPSSRTAVPACGRACRIWQRGMPVMRPVFTTVRSRSGRRQRICRSKPPPRPRLPANDPCNRHHTPIRAR